MNILNKYWLSFFLILTVCNFSALHSIDSDSVSYYYESLQNVQSEFNKSAKSIADKHTLVAGIHSILIDFLNSAEDEVFYEHLKNSRNYIEAMSSATNDIYEYIYGDIFLDCRPVVVEGQETLMYFNIFSQDKMLTEDERNFLYELEMERSKSALVMPKYFLDNETIKTLIPGQTYNFVVTLQKEVYFSYEQLYTLRKEAGKIVNTPNHTMLAENNPVLAAGGITYYRVGGKELYYIASTSGHFRPRPDSLVHMKNCLLKLGLPEESIICLGIAYHKIDGKIDKAVKKGNEFAKNYFFSQNCLP